MFQTKINCPESVLWGQCEVLRLFSFPDHCHKTYVHQLVLVQIHLSSASKNYMKNNNERAIFSGIKFRALHFSYFSHFFSRIKNTCFNLRSSLRAALRATFDVIHNQLDGYFWWDIRAICINNRHQCTTRLLWSLDFILSWGSWNIANLFAVKSHKITWVSTEDVVWHGLQWSSVKKFRISVKLQFWVGQMHPVSWPLRERNTSTATQNHLQKA